MDIPTGVHIEGIADSKTLTIAELATVRLRLQSHRQVTIATCAIKGQYYALLHRHRSQLDNKMILVKHMCTACGVQSHSIPTLHLHKSMIGR